MKILKKMTALLAVGTMLFTWGTGVLPESVREKLEIEVRAADEYTVGTYGVLTYRNYGDHVEITYCDQSATEVNIPQEIEGALVTEIGGSAFWACDQLIEVTIPNSVTTIGAGSFQECTALTEVTIPDSVTIISEDAFRWCSSLTKISISKNVTTIEEDVFYGCDSLVEVDIPDGVTTISAYAFHGCGGLTKVSISKSVSFISEHAFRWCESLTEFSVAEENENYTDLDGVLYSSDCTKLIKYPDGRTETSYIIPEGVTRICDGAFWNPISINSLSLPDSLVYIGEYSFYQCQNLVDIEIPEGVTTIGAMAFCACRNLTEISLPDSVTYIGDYAFLCCFGLGDEMVIPSNVEYIGPYIFHGEYLVNDSNPYFADIDGILFDSSYETLLSYPNIKSENAYSIPESVTEIGERAFYGSPNLIEITIPNNVVSIERYAFSWCTNLTSFIVPSRITEISDGTFNYCQSLSNITIPESVTTIGSSAFNYCDSLTDVYYTGTEEEWNAITINSGNECLTNATIHYNSTMPGEVDAEVQTYIDFITNNPDYYITSDTDAELTMAKKAAITDPSVTDYLWWKNILGQDDGDYHAELAIEAIVAELVVSDDVVQGIEAAAEQAAEQAMNDTLLMFAESTELFGIEGDELDALQDLVKTIEGGAVGVEFAAERSAWLSNFFKYADLTTLTAQLEDMSKNIQLVGTLYETVVELANAPEEVYNLYISSYAYHAANESFKDSLKLFNDYVQAEAATYTGEDDYSQRVRYVALQFENCYQRLIDTSDEKYTHYFEVVCSAAVGNAAMDLTYEAVTQLIIGCVTLACPQLGAALETLKLTLEIGMNVWEALSEVDERALERDMFLNMLVFSDAIGKAMNDTESGFPSVVLTDMDKHAVEMYQCGIKFYQKINTMMLEHAQMYLIMLRDDIPNTYADIIELYAGTYGEERIWKEYGVFSDELHTMYATDVQGAFAVVDDMQRTMSNDLMNLIPQLDNKQNQVKIHPLSVVNVIEAGIHTVYAIHCPVDITITQNGTTVAEVINDVITTMDETSGISIHLIRTSEAASASKFIMLPEDYELQILGNNTGTMSFEKAIIENGHLSTLSTITDIPVQSGSAYVEVIEDGITVALEYDQENDGVTDQTLTAEVTNVVTIGDVNSDGVIDPVDATLVLQQYSIDSMNGEAILDENQKLAANVNADEVIDPVDATWILRYYSYASMNGEGTIEDFIANN